MNAALLQPLVALVEFQDEGQPGLDRRGGSGALCGLGQQLVDLAQWITFEFGGPF